MTEDEALKMREELAKHYGESVMPASQYCKAFYTYFEQAETYIMGSLGVDKLFLRRLDTLIHKSSFLDRLIYGQEKLRMQKCEKHQGRWSGLPFGDKDTCCDLTGWKRAE